MLQIDIPEIEMFDSRTNEFIYIKATHLSLEHSLVSLKKWEAQWEKSFLKTREKTREEMRDYVRCMTLTQNVDPELYKHLPDWVITKVNEYIEKPMTAVYFPEENGPGGVKDTVTAELIYYWMIANQIPFDPCQKWHLNSLMALIKVCSLKNQDPKKRRMSQAELMRRNSKLNAERRKQHHSKG